MRCFAIFYKYTVDGSYLKKYYIAHHLRSHAVNVH